jgi:hypothetical protein
MNNLEKELKETKELLRLSYETIGIYENEIKQLTNINNRQSDIIDAYKNRIDRYEQALKKTIELPYTHDAIKSIVNRALEVK